MQLVKYRQRWALLTYDAGKRKRLVVWGDDRDENRPLAEREARRVLRERAQPVENTCQAVWDAYVADTTAHSKPRMEDAWKALRGTFAPLAPSDITRALCRQGRTVARCTAGGADVGEALVRAGMAWDTPYSGGAYADAEREAREAGRGVWGWRCERAEVWRAEH